MEIADYHNSYFLAQKSLSQTVKTQAQMQMQTNNVISNNEHEFKFKRKPEKISSSEKDGNFIYSSESNHFERIVLFSTHKNKEYVSNRIQ